MRMIDVSFEGTRLGYDIPVKANERGEIIECSEAEAVGYCKREHLQVACGLKVAFDKFNLISA